VNQWEIEYKLSLRGGAKPRRSNLCEICKKLMILLRRQPLTIAPRNDHKDCNTGDILFLYHGSPIKAFWDDVL